MVSAMSMAAIAVSIIVIVVCLIYDLLISISDMIFPPDKPRRYAFSSFFNWETQVIDLFFIYVMYIAGVICGIGGLIHYVSPKTTLYLYNAYNSPPGKPIESSNKSSTLDYYPPNKPIESRSDQVSPPQTLDYYPRLDNTYYPPPNTPPPNTPPPNIPLPLQTPNIPPPSYQSLDLKSTA